MIALITIVAFASCSKDKHYVQVYLRGPFTELTISDNANEILYKNWKPSYGTGTGVYTSFDMYEGHTLKITATCDTIAQSPGCTFTDTNGVSGPCPLFTEVQLGIDYTKLSEHFICGSAYHTGKFTQTFEYKIK